jgi:hypothetical protein
MHNKHTIECLREIPTTRITVLIGLVVCFTCGLVGRCNNQQASKSQKTVTQEESGYTADEAEELYNNNTPH